MKNPPPPQLLALIHRTTMYSFIIVKMSRFVILIQLKVAELKRELEEPDYLITILLTYF